MKFAASSPLHLICLAYLCGMLLANSFPPIFVFILFLLAGFITLWKKDWGFLLLLSFCLIGFLNLQIRNLPPPANDISNLPKNRLCAISGLIDDEPRFIDDKIFFTLKTGQGLVSVISRAAEIEYGDRVKVQGQLEEIEGLSNPGLLSFADYLKNQGVVCRLNASLAPPEIIKRGGGSFFKRVSIKIKDHLIKIPQKTLPEPYATLLSSIVFGSKAAKAPKEIKEVYKKAGVAHLLVASGMHLGILVGVCLFVVRSSRLPLWLGVLITTVVNLLYAVMTGFGPSILRAAIMAEIMLVGLLFEREKEIYTSLAISAFIILLYNPKFLFEVGFQLSFAATWSLVYVAPVIAERLKVFLPKTLATLASAALAPVLASTPITLYHFSSTSPIGIVTNMLLLPWVGVIVILGFVSTVLGVIFLPLAELINGANLILLWLADLIVTTLAKFPFAQLYLAPPRFPLVLGYYLGLVGLVEIMRRGKFPKINKFRLVLGILALGFLLVWNIALTDNFGGLTVTILDVGQGDSILVETPSGKRMLIDASERDMGEQVVVPYLLRRGIKKLDLVVMTHPHEDHVGGLPAVLENIKVEAVLEPGAVYENEAYYRFKALIKQNKIKHQLARAGQVVDFGQGCTANVLHPVPPFLENINEVSVVMRLKYGDFSMMLTGDNEREGEEQILERFPALSTQSLVLKVGHHGSGTSTSDEFLEAVNPKVAVISCGKHNKFRHPHGVTLKKLKERGIKVYRTDESGAVVVRSDGKNSFIEPQKK